MQNKIIMVKTVTNKIKKNTATFTYKIIRCFLTIIVFLLKIILYAVLIST